MKIKINVYSDAGHGWAQVQRAELKRLGILQKISSFSYQRGTYVYCEEDMDLSTYCDALRACGNEPDFVEHHTDSESQIRSYLPFQLTHAERDSFRPALAE